MMSKHPQTSPAVPPANRASPPPSASDFHGPARLFLVVAAVAFLIRLIYLLAIRDNVFFDHLVVDARAYDEWATRIANGDWLGNTVFYQAPLYPYFLGCLKTIGAGSPWAIRFTQICIGALSCGFLALAARTWARAAWPDRTERDGNLVGLVAGLMLALYAPAIHFDALIQKSVLDLFFSTLLLWRLGAIARCPTPAGWLVIGLLTGLLALTRETTLLLVIVFAGWLLLHFRRSASVALRGRWLATFIGGVAVIIAPVAIRNAVVGGELALTTSQAGPNFYIGNNPGAQGVYQPLRAGRSDPRFERTDAVELARQQSNGRALSPGEVSSFWFGRAFEFIRNEPGRWLRLLGWKAFLTFNATEVPDAEDQYFFEESSVLLRLLGAVWHFGILLPLALAGLTLLTRSWRTLWLLAAMIAALSLGTILFYVFARYRFPLAPVLIILAALGIVHAMHVVRSRRAGLLVAPVAALICVAVFSNWPPGGAFSRGVRLAGVLSNAGATLIGSADSKDHERAIAYFKRALEIDPTLADTRTNLALALSEKDPGGALEQLRLAAEQYPNDPRYARNYGTFLVENGRFDAGIAELRRAIALDPREFEARMNLARLSLGAGQFVPGIALLREAMPLAPAEEQPNIAFELGLLQATCPDPAGRNGPAAIALLEPLRKANDQSPEFLDILGAAYAAAGRFDDAITTAKLAISRAQASDASPLVPEIQERLALYEAGKPYVAPTPTSTPAPIPPSRP